MIIKTFSFDEHNVHDTSDIYKPNAKQKQSVC